MLRCTAMHMPVYRLMSRAMCILAYSRSAAHKLLHAIAMVGSQMSWTSSSPMNIGAMCTIIAKSKATKAGKCFDRFTDSPPVDMAWHHTLAKSHLVDSQLCFMFPRY